MTGRENELAVEGWNYLDGLLDKVQAILRELRELKDWMMQVFGDVMDVRDVWQNTCVLTTTVPYRGAYAILCGCGHGAVQAAPVQRAA